MSGPALTEKDHGKTLVVATGDVLTLDLK